MGLAYCAQRVECLPTCCSAENPARFPPTTSGEYLLGRYAATHAGYDASAKGPGNCLEGSRTAHGGAPLYEHGNGAQTVACSGA